MTKTILITSIVTTLTFSQAFSCDANGVGGFAPANDQKIYVGDKAANNMTEEKFLDAVNRVSSIYAPIVQKLGKTLVMNNYWTNPQVNASAKPVGSQMHVNMYGGLARHKFATVDGFMMVVCHELGHHLGGAPRYEKNTGWGSSEGQADYFAGLKCMRRVLENEDNIAIVAEMDIDADATTKCESIYKSASEVALCQRISMAGKSLANVLSDLDTVYKEVNFNTPDLKTVNVTFENHPEAQCRLDTYTAGALCDKSILEDVSRADSIPGTCIKKDGYVAGFRPLCWYRPGSNEI